MRNIFLHIRNNLFYRILIFSISFLILIAVGMLRGGDTANVDLSYLYSAGKIWSNGKSPYVSDEFVQIVRQLVPSRDVKELVFVYPPWGSLFCIFISKFSFFEATIIFKMTNLLALFTVIKHSLKSISPDLTPWSFFSILNNLFTRKNWIFSSLIFILPPVSTVFWLGQTSLIALAALVLSWNYYLSKRWVLSGIFLSIASIKPQISLLVLIWFLLERQWKILAITSGILVLSCIPSFVSHSSLVVISDWLKSIQAYTATPLNTEMGGTYMFTVRNLLYLMGVKTFSLIGVSTLLCGLVWQYKDRLRSGDILPIIMMIALLFCSSHLYDLVMIIPAMAVLWKYFSVSGVRKIFGLISFMIVMAPARVFDTPFFLGSRILVATILLATLISFSYSSRKEYVQNASR